MLCFATCKKSLRDEEYPGTRTRLAEPSNQARRDGIAAKAFASELVDLGLIFLIEPYKKILKKSSQLPCLALSVKKTM